MKEIRTICDNCGEDITKDIHIVKSMYDFCNIFCEDNYLKVNNIEKLSDDWDI